MTKQEKQKLAESLQSQLNRTEQMWKEGEFSHAYIIGWLQGVIKTTIVELGFQNS
jgi:hypothetical protein